MLTLEHVLSIVFIYDGTFFCCCFFAVFPLTTFHIITFICLKKVIATSDNSELSTIVQMLKAEQSARATKLRELVQQNLCLVNFFSNIEAL